MFGGIMKRLLLFLLILSVICAAGKLYADAYTIIKWGHTLTRTKEGTFTKWLQQGKLKVWRDGKWIKVRQEKIDEEGKDTRYKYYKDTTDGKIEGISLGG